MYRPRRANPLRSGRPARRCRPIRKGDFTELPNGAQPGDSGDFTTDDTRSYTFDARPDTNFSRRDFVEGLLGTLTMSPLLSVEVRKELETL